MEDAHAAVLAELPGVIIHQGPLICEAILEGFLKDTAKADEIYTVGQYKIDLETHLTSFLQAIPPIETGVKLAEKQPTDFAAILNVGWVALLCKLDEFEIDTGDEPDHLIHGAKAETLHSLLLKALELSEIRREWGKQCQM